MPTLEYAKNPSYSDEEGKCISLVVKWVEYNEEFPFGATPWDIEEYGRDLYQRAKAGEFGEIAPYSPPPPLPDSIATTII